METTTNHTAHEYLTRTSAATHTAEDLTLIWSTLPQHCEPGNLQHRTAQWDADHPPRVWDRTGLGDWEVAAHVQCGTCGTTLAPIAAVHEGHLHGADLDAACRRIAEQAAAA